MPTRTFLKDHRTCFGGARRAAKLSQCVLADTIPCTLHGTVAYRPFPMQDACGIVTYGAYTRLAAGCEAERPINQICKCSHHGSGVGAQAINITIVHQSYPLPLLHGMTGTRPAGPPCPGLGLGVDVQTTTAVARCPQYFTLRGGSPDQCCNVSSEWLPRLTTCLVPVGG